MASRPIGAGWAIMTVDGAHCLRVGDHPAPAEPLLFQPITEGVGAKFTADTTCTDCRKKFVRGDAITIVAAEGMAGSFHHTDCDNPQPVYEG